MGISYTDSYGPVTDTGCGTQPTVRVNTELETHASTEVDTGTTFTAVATTIPTKHIPHRSTTSPR